MKRALSMTLATLLTWTLMQGSPVGAESLVSSIDGLTLVERNSSGVLFLRLGHRIGGYDAFLIDPVHITYKSDRRRLTDREEGQVETHLLETLEKEILSQGLQIAEAPGPCTLRVGLAVLGVELADLPKSSGASTIMVSSLGRMTLITEYRDSLTSEVQLRFATKRNIKGGWYNPGVRSHRWRKMRGTFDKMMATRHLNLAHATPSIAASEPRLQCQGMMAKHAAAMLIAGQ